MGKKVKVNSAVEASDPSVVERRPYVLKRAVYPKKAPRYRRWKGLAYLLVLLGLVLGIVLYVYYQRYSVIIDNGLQGKIFERSSGVYAAPLTLRSGSPARMAALIQHLKNIGYVEQRDLASAQTGAAEPETRGRYALLNTGNAISIYPSSNSKIDGLKLFQPLQVVFGPSGAGIQSITATETRQSLNEAQIEPEQISATINEQREKRRIIEYKDLPSHLVLAITVTEDRSFFDHSGVSIRGILRAFFRNYEAGEVREGGSTITQQLVKGFFLTPERTLKRKLAEAYMAIILEQKLTKKQIMAMYCNQIYLGQRGGFSINGFGEAARAYFGKDINQLEPHESALLAGIIRSPNYYSLRSYKDSNAVPDPHEQRALERRNLVLDLMASVGKVEPEAKPFTTETAQIAKRQPLGVKDSGRTDASDAPYFVDYVMRQLDEQYGEDTQSMRSMRIYTTVDLDLQRAAYDAVAAKMPEISNLVAQRRGGLRGHGLQAALVAMNPKTGDVLAMIGGQDYAMSQLNRATDAKRQPGSVFKPFVYAAGLSESDPERRITPAMIFRDEPRSFEFNGKYYSPGNFGDTYENRAMTVREALTKSKNVIAVSVAERVGFQQVANFAQRAGLINVPAVPSVALGAAEATPLQMASAYTAFANQGKRVAPVGIRRLTTKDGATIYDAQTQTSDVMSPQVAYLMTTILQDVLDYGTGTKVRQLGFREIAAGKTGSSRDGWFAGYTPNLVCVVWVGFDDNTDIGVTGGSTAALIWADFMIHAMQLRPDLDGGFEAPREGLVTLYIDPATGQPAQTDTPGARPELFLSGTEAGEGQPFSPPPLAEPTPIKVTPDTTSASTAEPPGTGIVEAAPPENRGLLGNSSDSIIPIPPEARDRIAVTGAQPAGSTGMAPSLGTNNPPIKVPRTTATPLPVRPPSGKPTPAPRSAQGSSGRINPWPTPPIQSARSAPTSPWPTPRESTPPPAAVTTPRQAPKPQPTIIVINKPAAEARSGRPRIVPTPQPTPKPKPVGRTAKTIAPTKNAPAKTASAKTGKPIPKPTPAQLAKATKPTPKPLIKPTPQAKQTPVQATPTPTPKPVNTPAPGKTAASSGKTFSLEVCAVSGLIPVKGICKTVVRRTFRVGEEPTKQCSAEKHGGN